MYIILDTKYFDDDMVGTEVIGYFTSYELAEQYLFENGYKLDEYSDELFTDGEVINHYYLVDDDTYVSCTAKIEKLELIK